MSGLAPLELSSGPGALSTVGARPVVLISCSHKQLDIPGFGPLGYHAVFKRYVEAVCAALD